MALLPVEDALERLLADAGREAETLRREAQVEAREQAIKLRAEIEAEVGDRRVQIAKIEERISQTEADVDEKLTELGRREHCDFLQRTVSRAPEEHRVWWDPGNERIPVGTRLRQPDWFHRR